MEPQKLEKTSLLRFQWVEEIRRLSETVGEDDIYVVVRPLGSYLFAKSSLPGVDAQQIRFPLRPQWSLGEESHEMSVVLPMEDTSAEFATVLGRTGHKCFLATIWPCGLEQDWIQTELFFSTNLEVLRHVAFESPSE